jgi:hypothetical protein
MNVLFAFMSVFLGGCASHIDGFTLNKVLPVGMSQPDLGKACALGEGLNHPLRSLTSVTPNKAMIIAETTSALCTDSDAMEADILAEQYKFLKLIPQAIDAKISAERLHTQTAQRYYRAYLYTESAFGDMGTGACPDFKGNEEAAYLIGLVAGTLSVIHNRIGGNKAGVPDVLLPKIARASECVENQKWWHTPQALRAAVWAFVPGSGPESVDAWAHLKEAGSEGAKTNFRIAWGIHNLIAAMSGKEDLLKIGLEAHAVSIDETSVGGEWALLDEYGFRVSQHMSDLIWTREEGHRTMRFGSWPIEETSEEDTKLEEDLFEEDPF